MEQLSLAVIPQLACWEQEELRFSAYGPLECPGWVISVRSQEPPVPCLLPSRSILEVLLRQLLVGDPSPKEMKSPILQNLIKLPKRCSER